MIRFWWLAMSIEFWVSDERLEAAARRERLTVFKPGARASAMIPAAAPVSKPRWVWSGQPSR